MSGPTSIEWCDYSWNPIRALNPETGKKGWFCVHASDGCINCYSEAHNHWVGTQIDYKAQNRNKVELLLDAKELNAPQRWKEPGRVFVCSMTDLFAPFVPDEWVAAILNHAVPTQHTFLVLTKRAERQWSYCRDQWDWSANIWHGVSVEDRITLDRLDWLRETAAVICFVSFEPLLEDLGPLDLAGIDWVIVGAESGRHARPMQLDWVRNIRDQCITAGVPLFFKQDARRARKIPLPELDGRQWCEFPTEAKADG